MKLWDEIQTKKPQVMELAEKYGVYDIKIFGYAARGDDDEKSDIDLLVSWREGSGHDRFSRLFDFKSGMENLFSRKVDVLSEKFIKGRLKDFAMKDAKII